MQPVKSYANQVYVQCSREKICRFHCIFLGDYDPYKIKNLSLTGKVWILIIFLHFDQEPAGQGWEGRALMGAETQRPLSTHHPGLTPAAGTHGLRLRL